MTPTPHFSDEHVTVYEGDCRAVMATLPDESVDSVVTDPPYGLEFMGKEWDRFSGAVTDRDFKGFVLSQQRTRNVKCPECSKWAYDHPGRLCECGGIRRAQGSTFQQWCELWAVECLRLLKPGGHLLAFGGSRTHHRLTCAIEDAGFEIRDSISWLYGSGFPKSLDVSKAIDKAAGAQREVIGMTKGKGGENLNALARPGGNDSDDASGCGAYGQGAQQVTIDIPLTAPATDAAKQWQGWGTALKPSWEPIVVARKPLRGTVAGNVVEQGTGALNIDACRVGSDERINSPSGAPGGNGIRLHGGDGRDAENARAYAEASKQLPPTAVTGRWPTNVVIDEHTAEQIDDQTGVLKSGANPTPRSSDKFRNAYGDFAGQQECIAHRGADEGGASRFFPTFRYEAKAPTTERPTYVRDGAALDTYRTRKRCTHCGKQGVNSQPSSQCQCSEPNFEADPSQQNVIAHPTVKPLDLMRWLVRLVTPPHGLVLDPFAGSGTTAEACVHEHMRCITIEREPDYLPLIVARLTKPMAVGFDFGEESA